MATHSDSGGAAELPALLAAHPSSVTRILADHVDDGTGHCSVCTIGGQAGRMTWPCRLHQLATDARGWRP